MTGLTYTIGRGESVTIPFVVDSDANTRIAKLRRIMNGVTLERNDPAGIELTTTDRAATNTLAAGWDIRLPSSLTRDLALGLYQCDIAFSNNGTDPTFTRPVFVRIVEAASSS